MLQTCRLCGVLAELQDSHVLPAFVGKWLKETSATGFLRFGQIPNRRVQDSYRRPWLCRDCEGRLNTWETKFAASIFHPLNADGAQRIVYADWLLKFSVSISWRVLLLMKEDDMLGDLTGEQSKSVDAALAIWSDFILGKLPHPGRFEQHFIALDAIEDPGRLGFPANINRYILRTIDLDFVRNSTTAFTLAKMGKFFVLGFVDVKFPKQWVGTKVHVRSGVVGQGDYTLPKQFGAYLSDEAERFATVYKSISHSQRERIEKAMWGDIERVARSGSFEAMKHDVELFGKDAFQIHRASKQTEAKD